MTDLPAWVYDVVIEGNARCWVSAYTLSATPAGADQYNHPWDITVQHSVQMDGSAKWAVRSAFRCLSVGGQWDTEPIPSYRTDEWLDEHRFDDVHAALEWARRAAPDVEVNGVKAKDVVNGD